ncbi:MAG: hypothetical protein IJM96_01050, partial [Clostridia bacterium]|nr:hypothetical protein [Clostridia bacterium]
ESLPLEGKGDRLRWMRWHKAVISFRKSHKKFFAPFRIIHFSHWHKTKHTNTSTHHRKELNYEISFCIP